MPTTLQAMIVAESFGGCLALRVARAVPQLIERMVLVNPATSFARSYARIPSLIAATNLLSIFPEQLYQARPLSSCTPHLRAWYVSMCICSIRSLGTTCMHRSV